MTKLRSTLAPASCELCRRQYKSGPAFLLTLAGILTAALVTAAVPVKWVHESPALPRAIHAPAQPKAEPLTHTRIAAPEIAPRADMLAGGVAGRHRLAAGAAV